MEHCSDRSGPKGRHPKGNEFLPELSSIILFFLFTVVIFQPIASGQNDASAPQILTIIPHDSNAFTQGLEIYDGRFYESTGLYGSSSVRIVNMSTGEIELQKNLEDSYFGEGLTINNDTIIQLTWKENVAFIYDIDTLELIDYLSYEGEGWGICKLPNSNNFLMTDGTGKLKHLSDNFSQQGELEIFLISNSVRESVDNLNELECTSNGIFVNVWYEDWIYFADYRGKVCRTIDFSSVREQYENESSGVMNGIAWDQNNGTYWITGKNWLNYYEVKINDNPCFVSGVPSSTPSLVSNNEAGGFGELAGLLGSLFFIILLHYPYSKKKSRDRQNEKPSSSRGDEK
tara:strand:+ start:58769 stop:59800 length:1032 start_codon:yes stop_codon:yes gene_type:complete